MTPEQELELLIAEQQADDTYYIDRPAGEISLDAPGPDGYGTIGDLIGVDDEGEVSFFAARRLPSGHTSMLGRYAPLSNAHQHGTIYAYRRLRCRCVPCTAVQAKTVREYRARKRAES